MRPALTSSCLASAGLRVQRPVMRGIPTIVNIREQLRRRQQVGHLLRAIATRNFSVHAPLRNKQDQKQQSQDQQGGDPELPAFSFNGLGASKGIKNAIIVILCIFGTMETWMWCKWIWTWWKGAEEEKQGLAAQ